MVKPFNPEYCMPVVDRHRILADMIYEMFIGEEAYHEIMSVPGVIDALLEYHKNTINEIHKEEIKEGYYV